MTTINGTLGNDILNAGPDTERVNGKIGNDLIRVPNKTEGPILHVYGGQGQDTVAANNTDGNINLAFIVATGVEHLHAKNIYGSVAQINQFGQFSDPSGGGWIFYLGGPGGALDLFGRTGGLFVHVDATFAGAVNLGGTAFNDRLVGSAFDDTLLGGSGNDTLVGNGGNDVLYGGGGDDILTTAYFPTIQGPVVPPGNASIYGGAGNDTIRLDMRFHATFADMQAATGVISGGAGVDRVISFHLGSHSFSGVERLEVNGLPNSITGNWNLWARIDQLAAFQTIAHETIASGFVSIALWGDGGRMNFGARVDPAYAVRADAGAVTSPVELIGTANDDTLAGSALNDTLDGGAGVDVLRGGLGDDLYFLRDPRDVIEEFADEGTDIVLARFSHTLADHVEHLGLLPAAGAADATGNALDNIIEGNRRANVLSGLDGNDTLFGAGGRDTLIGGSGADYFVFFDSYLQGRLHIADFEAGTDVLWFFADAVGLPEGVLNSANFRANRAGIARDADDMFLYSTRSGKLYFDADGNGEAAAVLIATLAGAPALTASDIRLGSEDDFAL